jgi:hypothetical protein
MIGQWLYTFSQQENFTFALAVGSPIMTPQQDNSSSSPSGSQASSSDAGILHLLQPDPAYYDPDNVCWVSANTSTDANTGDIPPSDWTVVLDGWVASTKSNQLSSKGQIVAEFEPMYTNVYIPQDQAALIC